MSVAGRAFVPSLCLAALLAGVARADTTARLVGTVKDPSGAPVAGASIQLVHQGFGDKLTLKSDAKGSFTRLAVKPGDYEMTVEARGYAAIRQALHVGLGKNPVDLVLVPESAAGGAATTEFSLGGKKVSGDAAASFEKARAALAAGDVASARTEIQKLIELEPTLANPRFLLAQLQRDAGERDAAAATLRQALELEPGNAGGWMALGEILADAGKAPEAAEALRKAAALEGSGPAVHKKLGMVLLGAADYAGAAQALEKYLELAPDAADAAQKRELLEECRKLAAK